MKSKRVKRNSVIKSDSESIKKELSKFIAKNAGISAEEVRLNLGKPPSLDMGDVAFPCFSLVKKRKKPPRLIAEEIKDSIGKSKMPEFIRDVEVVEGYVNFYFNRKVFSEKLFKEVLKKTYGTNKSGKGKKVVIEMSSPNIAKHFGIGHLRSTIIGESLSRIYAANGYKTVKINYLGDWGTQFGKLIYGIKNYGKSKLEDYSLDDFQELYVKVNLKMDKDVEEASRNYFKLMEQGNKEVLSMWKRIRKISIKEFNEIYDLLGVSFDYIGGESEQGKRSQKITKDLLKKGIAKESNGSVIVDLEKEGKGVGILRKSDGTTIYLSRDIAAAIERKKKYKFDYMLYEVGSEQKLHFQQLFRILEMMNFKWSKNLKHINHGLYLGLDRKKISTRHGSSVRMRDIWESAFKKVVKEIKKRGKFSKKDMERAEKITRSAILYADLSNYRETDVRYDVDAIVSMEGDTGHYLLYSYARCKSILRKLKYKRKKILVIEPDEEEYKLISKFSEFPDVVLSSRVSDDPSKVARYAMELARSFNSFYSKCRVKGDPREEYRAQLIEMYSLVLKSSLDLIGIEVVKKM